MTKINFILLKLFVFQSLNLNFPGERKNKERTAWVFHGNGPYCKIPTVNQSVPFARELLAI